MTDNESQSSKVLYQWGIWKIEGLSANINNNALYFAFDHIRCPETDSTLHTHTGSIILM